VQLSDWYQISRIDVQAKGGLSLFAYYGNLREALTTLYPQYPWDLKRFAQPAPKGYWQDRQNQMKALRVAEEQLGITKVRTNTPLLSSTFNLFHLCSKRWRIGDLSQCLILKMLE